MLARSNDTQLQRYQKINAEYIFFYQRWREMLESRTLDMYQYNILNSYVACMELYDVIEKTMSGLLTSRQNVDDCKQEAYSIVKSDVILEKHNRPLKIMLLRILSSKIDGKSRNESNDDKNGAQYISLNRLKYQLKTPIRQLQISYLSYIMIDLKEAIDNLDNSKTECCSNILISQCVFIGWSAKGLFKLADCFSGNKNSTEKWEEFRSRIVEHPFQSYDVYYSLKIETAPGLDADNIRRTIRALGLRTELGEQILEESRQKPDLCSKITPTTTYLILNVSATDIYAGVLTAINILNSKLSTKRSCTPPLWGIFKTQQEEGLSNLI